MAWSDLHADPPFPSGRRSAAEAIEFRTTYFAVAIEDVLREMRDAGLGDVRRTDNAFYQPLLIGTVQAPA